MKKEKRIVQVRYADSLSELYQHVYNISEDIRETEQMENERPLLWFRGHANAAYNLNPNIFRGADFEYNQRQTYGNNHLREEYRFQSFMSRNFDNVTYRMPQSMMEWQEVMQHFFSKTRLMDWSESLTVSLEFALESFITPSEDLEVERRRRTASPVIWILRPTNLNKEVYHSFAADNDGKLCGKVLSERMRNENMHKKIVHELGKEEKEGTYFNLKKDNERNYNAMISLSALKIIWDAYKERVEEALSSFELNPFFFLLLRYYADGVPVEIGELPPLAIIHPYHSQRIKIQKGVFTVFPHYIPDIQMKQIERITGKYPAIGMEYMEQCIPFLYKIQITNPKRIADELLLTGSRRGDLYPDMQIISQDMENVVSLNG